MLKDYAERVELSAKKHKVDIVLSTTTLAAYQALDVPLVTWPDATLQTMLKTDAYPMLNSLSAKSKDRLRLLEKRLLETASANFLPTQTGAIDALEMAPNAKVMVAPFGPNLPIKLLEDAWTLRTQSLPPSNDFLFMGVDWIRKGGDIALRAIAELGRQDREDRKPVILHVVGDCPPSQQTHPLLRFHGKLAPENTRDRSILVELLATCRALVLPTRADNYGAVVVEAAASGLPVLTSSSCGASEHVQQQGFGFVIQPSDSLQYESRQYAEGLARLGAPDYMQISHKGRLGYVEKLNYTSSVTLILREFGLLD
ncbi:hypothetical protein NCCP1664_01990 [Zafaria cholistanensis]|uniref:Glycosyltransferase n=1 Tax=Zafaria cholistanensis TaxID=1682741 RepID=A0A5A7NNE3_9MICC|nr:glycosyltransferase [Zafaria cholistanensis]GER21702.1 hypothetical protein NCCP1664_01990 [Zafaria cholistanensis]